MGGRDRGKWALVAAVVLFVAVIVLVIAGDDQKGGGSASAGPLPPLKAGMPLTEPPVVKSLGNTLTATLVAKNGTISVSGVDIANTQTYAVAGQRRGLFGPTLHVKPGDTIDLTLDNQLVNPENVRRGVSDRSAAPTCPPKDDPHGMHDPPPPDGKQNTNLHFHGLHVTPRTRKFHGQTVYGDNVLLNLPPGKSHFRFQIPPNHDEGTFWYHAHRHGCTDDQVFRGLAGLLIVGDVRTKLPERFRNVRTRSFAIRDVQAVRHDGGWAVPNDHDWGPENPKLITVNGLLRPKLDIQPGETQLWRLADVSAALWYRFALVDPTGGAQDEFTIVANDGNPSARPQRVRSVLLGPGHRVDILVRGPAQARQIMSLPFAQGRYTLPSVKLADLVPGKDPSLVLADDTRRRPLPTFPTKRGPTRRFTFSTTDDPKAPPYAQWLINGRGFDPDRVDADPVRGTAEKWILINRTDEYHPFHIHQDDFRVLSVNGKRVKHPPSDQDIVPLPPVHDGIPGRVEILMPFQDYSGNFVFHCHILDHEDGGMMARVDVREPRRRR